MSSLSQRGVRVQRMGEAGFAVRTLSSSCLSVFVCVCECVCVCVCLCDVLRSAEHRSKSTRPRRAGCSAHALLRED